VNVLSLRRYAYSQVSKRRSPLLWKHGKVVEMELIVPVIDGTPLHELLGHGGLPGIPSGLVEPVAVQWTSTPGYRDDEGRAVIIDGECTEARCCGVLAEIRFTPATTTWSRFGNDCEDLVPRAFTFDRTAYERVIAGIASLPATPVRVKI
jgi:hypothetical protein